MTIKETGESSNLLYPHSILAKLGLKERMEWNVQKPFIFNNRVFFDRYLTEDYLTSTRREDDHIYRMVEIVILHKPSGLRLEYLETESWDGDELSYRLRNGQIFIITLEQTTVRIRVNDVDFLNKEFLTREGAIPFSAVKKDRATI